MNGSLSFSMKHRAEKEEKKFENSALLGKHSINLEEIIMTWIRILSTGWHVSIIISIEFLAKMTIPDLQQNPHKVCQIEYELKFNVIICKTDYF